MALSYDDRVTRSLNHAELVKVLDLLNQAKSLDHLDDGVLRVSDENGGWLAEVWYDSLGEDWQVLFWPEDEA
jgi:hypothetical protein